MSQKEIRSQHELGAPEQRYVDRVARDLGSADIEDLARTLGCRNSRALAERSGFNDMYAFLSADGSGKRCLDLRKALTAARRTPVE